MILDIFFVWNVLAEVDILGVQLPRFYLSGIKIVPYPDLFAFYFFMEPEKTLASSVASPFPSPPPPLLMYLSTSPLGGGVGASQQLVIYSGEEPSVPLPKCFSSPKWQYLCLFYGKYFEIFKNIAMFHLRTRKHSGGHSWMTNWQVVRDILYPYLAWAPLFGQASRYITTSCRKFIQIRGCSVIPRSWVCASWNCPFSCFQSLNLTQFEFANIQKVFLQWNLRRNVRFWRVFLHLSFAKRGGRFWCPTPSGAPWCPKFCTRRAKFLRKTTVRNNFFPINLEFKFISMNLS